MEKARHVNRIRKVAANWRLILVIVIVVVLVLFVLGIVIGYFIGLSQGESDEVKAALREADSSITDDIIDEMSANNIKENLKYLTSIPHLAGTPADQEQADYIVELWRTQGLEHAEAVPYRVLLSYPNTEEGKENKVQILNPYNPDDEPVFTSQPKEKILDPSQDHPDVVPPFNAYSAAGIVAGDVLYANYARVEDFFHLQRDRKFELNGTIIIARYGKIYRGDKVANAMEVGAKGIILYSDPEDVAPAGEPTYPDGIYLPETGVQRGSTLKDSMDPLTPGYPATGYAFRIEEKEATLPQIPVHPISYADAKEILNRMVGNEVPEDWRGAIDGLTYKYGPGFGTTNGLQVQITVHSYNEQRTAYNTIGLIRGNVEPDRYVILGNHRDAWGFGAIDPTSGTATLLEVTRVFGKLLKNGWRPRRTMVFCTWGAEEYGLIGSNEWVEENMKNLISRGVAYVNVDAPAMGTYRLSAGGTPNMKKLIYAAAKKIPDANPEGSRKTMYDTWKTRGDTYEDTNEPMVHDLGSGSDYASFLHRMGLSAIDMRYHWDDSRYDFSIYPMYHSVYETYHLVETFYDPDFKYLQAMARLWAELGRQLADSLIIPMDSRDYGSRIKKMFEEFKTSENAEKIRNRGKSLDTFEDAANTFYEATQTFHDEVQNVNKKDPMAIRRINDKIIMLERGFIDPLGLPERPFTRHVIFAPSSKDAYASTGFPGLTDALFDIDNSLDPNKQWREIEREIAVITYHLYSAATTLTDEITSLTRKEL